MLGTAQPVLAQTDIAATRDGNGDAKAAQALLARPVSIALDRVSLKHALDSISMVARVLVQYRAPMVNAYTTPVTIHATRLPLGVVLERVLDGTRLHVVPDGEGYLTVVPVETKTDSLSNTGIVTGRIVDSATGRGISGATAKVAGMKISAITNDSGRFVLDRVPAGEQLITVRGFGFRPAERPVTVVAGERATMRLALAQTANVLSGVVTTATGVQDRRTVGNDITVIHADSVLRTAPIRTLTDLLEGRVPGLVVQRTSGVPGAPSRLRLRGITGGLIAGSSRSNDPILIVDGIRVHSSTSTQRDQNGAAGNFTAPSGFDQIDPNSIETVEVMKGPSASALYGADAANGVIVVTTKRGQNGPLRIDATASYGINYMPGFYAGPGFYNFGHGSNVGSHQCGLTFDPPTLTECIQDSLVQFQALNIPRLSVFGTGNEQLVSGTVSGGTSAVNYALTASRDHTLGYFKMPDFYKDQFQTRYKQDVQEWMKRPNTNATSNMSASVIMMPRSGLQITLGGAFATQDQLQSSAQTSFAELGGKYIDTTILQDTILGRYTQRVTSNDTRTDLSAQATWSELSWLPLWAVLGRSVSDRDDQSSVPYGYYGPLGGTDTSGSFSYTRIGTRTQTMQLTGKVFPTARVATSVGINIVKTVDQDFNGNVSTLTPGVSVPTAFTIAGQARATQNTAGWFVEPKLNLNNRLFASPGFRLDNTGTGSTDGKGLTALFPKINFSWIAIDREGERPFAGVLTMLRPHIALGVSANQPHPEWALRLMGPGNLGANGISYPGVRLQTVGNPDLKPSQSRELETGFDATFLGNRVTVMATHAFKQTSDEIAQVAIAPSVGSANGAQYHNIGTVRNTSTEISLTLVPVQNATTSWSIAILYTALKNTVVKLNDDQQAIDLFEGARAVAGYPLDGLWERPILGYSAPPAGQPFGASNVFLGDSVQYLGHGQPTYTLPVQTSLSLWGGRIALDAHTEYTQGITQAALGNLQLLNNLYLDPDASLAQRAAALAAFCKLNQASSNANYCASKATNAGVVQTINVFRLQSMSLSYNVSSRTSQRFHLPRTSIQLQGSNLGLWTGYRGKDPDVNGSPVGESLRDSGQEPLPRTWSVQVRLGVN